MQQMPKIGIPKIKINKPDLSKINLRKFNWLTVAGILAYLNILVLIPFFFVKKSPFVQFHAKQGLALLVLTAVALFTFYFPVVPWIFVIFIFICLIIGITNVITGRERVLPLIGKYAK